VRESIDAVIYPKIKKGNGEAALFNFKKNDVY